MIISGKTSTGYEYEIDDRARTDWRVVKLLEDLNSTDYSVQAVACNKLIAFLLKDKGESLEKHIEGMNDGFIPTAAMMKEVAEIMQGDEDIKK